MNDLLNGIENTYRSYVQGLNISNEVKTDFIELLNNENCIERQNSWDTLRKNYTNFDFSKLANPYYIGYGNPNSDILFVGKEKGFDICKYPGLFIRESINNTLHWTHIYQNNNNLNAIDNASLIQNLGFNPVFPKAYFTDKFPARHTWGIYSKIVSGLIGQNFILNESNDFKSSFFSKCFLTEINHIPSKYSNGLKMIEQREQFFNNDFFSSFNAIIIGAKGYLTIEQIKILFRINPNNRGEEIKLGANRKRDIIAHLFNDNNRKIIYCNQLSGAAGWTNDALKRRCCMNRLRRSVLSATNQAVFLI